MKGIQYIIDDQGDKTAVVIDLKQWGNLWEEFANNFLAKNLREKEQWLYQDNGEEKIDQALEWCNDNPPQQSNLEQLESEINSNA